MDRLVKQPAENTKTPPADAHGMPIPLHLAERRWTRSLSRLRQAYSGKPCQAVGSGGAPIWNAAKTRCV